MNFSVSCLSCQVLPEALEQWPVNMMQALLPRHIQIMYDINHFFLVSISKRYPDDANLIRNVSIFQEGDQRMVRNFYVFYTSC